MAIPRNIELSVDELVEQMKKEGEHRATGRIQWFRANSTDLRIVPFLHPDTDAPVWYAKVAYHRKADTFKGAPLGTCRAIVDGEDEPCAFCRVNRLLRDKGQDEMFPRQFRYLVFGIDVNQRQPTILVWQLPNQVWDDIMGLLTGRWPHLLSPDEGHAVQVIRDKSTDFVKYSASPHPEPWPVPDDLLESVENTPFDLIQHQSFEEQCEVVGMEPSVLLRGGEGEDVAIAPDRTSGRKSSRAEPEPQQAGRTPGGKLIPGEGAVIEVLGEDEEWVRGTVTSVDGNAVEVDFGDDEVIELELDDCEWKFHSDSGKKKAKIKPKSKAAAPAAEKPSSAKPAAGRKVPKCFGKYDGKDSECRKCSDRIECAAGASQKGRGAAVKPKGKSAKKGGSETADALAILGIV